MLEACSCWKSKSEANERATAGTLGHKVVETGEDDPSLSDYDAAAAAECLDFVETRRRKMQAECAGEIIELKETYLPIDDCVFDDCRATTAGYVDHVLINSLLTYAEMIDYKFGMWAVEKADNNLQGISYALGLFKKYPTLGAIRFFFKQPHLGLVSDALFLREDVSSLYLRVQAVVARARAARKAGDFKTATPMVPACNFCDNLGRCPRGLEFALRVSNKFMPLEFPEDITPSKVLAPEATSLAMRLAQVMKIWADAFRRQVTDRVLRGDAVLPPGYAVQAMPGRRSVADMKKFKEICLRYMTEVQYLDCLEASFGPLEKVISSAAPRGQKETTVKEFQSTLEQAGAVIRGDGYSFLRVQGTKA